ncbi:MAG: restriction endonuclease subunit S [Actinobacteria bacterium]|nr:restriction endonuclease subunit S [Actinomycetota bacterium]
MSEWREVTLGEVCELKRGYDLPTSKREAGDVPIVSSSGITGYHSVAKVPAPGVVTGRYGTLGNVFFIEEPFWPLNTALYVRDFKGNDPRFVAALLGFLELAKSEGAAAVPGVNRNHLHRLPVLCPGFRTQQHVAAILGSLDDLADNNLRRIELLEQMAQAIYREWFVDFRFPGHEDATSVHSPLGPIPSGWSVRTASDLINAGLLDVGDGYRAKNEEMIETDAGLPFVRVRNVRDGYLDLSTCDRLPAEYQRRLGGKVGRPGDSVICMKGTVGRSAFIQMAILLSHTRRRSRIGALSTMLCYHELISIYGRVAMTFVDNVPQRRELLIWRTTSTSGTSGACSCSYPRGR